MCKNRTERSKEDHQEQTGQRSGILPVNKATAAKTVCASSVKKGYSATIFRYLTLLEAISSLLLREIQRA